MPEFEQVCRRLFYDSAWLGKCVVGAVLVAIPILHFFAFGYLGRVVSAAARGQEFDLPSWGAWGDLFLRGVMFFVIFLGLTGGLFLAAWVVSLPFWAWAGPLAFVPLMVATVLAPVVTAAGWYRYCLEGELVDAFRISHLVRLIQEAGGRLVLPTFAYIGFLFIGFPLFPLAFFIGGIVVFYFYSSIFCHVENGSSGQSDVSFSVL